MPSTSIGGTDITSATIDGDTVQEITADGDVVYTANNNIPNNIPDNSVYRWVATYGIGAGDGQETNGWIDQLENINAGDTGDPIYNDNQGGKEAVKYDGSEGHSWSPDSQLPTGKSNVSLLVTVYPTSDSSFESYFGWGELWFSQTVSGKFGAIMLGGGNAIGSSYNNSEWNTGMIRYDGSMIDVFVNGETSPSGTESRSISVSDASHAIGYRRTKSNGYFGGYMHEAIVVDGLVSGSDYQTYHNSKI